MSKPLTCSFCAKTQIEVKALIAGPAVFICDECIGLCVAILDGDAPTVRLTDVALLARALDRFDAARAELGAAYDVIRTQAGTVALPKVTVELPTDDLTKEGA
jgi:hypothetical protein